MKTRTVIIAVLSGILATAGCTSGNEYEPQYNVPEGVYVTGSATMFSVETAYGALKEMDDPRIMSLSTWLSSEGEFFISLTGPDHQPVVYGGTASEPDSGGYAGYDLVKGGPGMTVPQTGLYKVFYSTSLARITLVPYDFKMVGVEALTEDGNNILSLGPGSYDKLNHVVTWVSSDEPLTILSGEYQFRWAGSGDLKIPLSGNSSYSVRTWLTGTESSTKTNILSAEQSELTSSSDVNLNLKKKGSYVVTVSYDVRKALFFGTVDGTEFIVPEPSGMPEALFMTGDSFGASDWSSPDVISMTPCGVAGNGVFWTLAYIRSGEGVKWSTSRSAADEFSSGDTNEGFTVKGGLACPDREGAYLIFVDLYNKIIAFEQPQLYAMGECFGGADVGFSEDSSVYTVTTTSEGNLRMYALCSYNERDWDTMEFGILNGKINYRGLGAELTPTPVVEDVPIVLDFPAGKASIKGRMSSEVPFSGQVYMITDEYGDMNWGNPDDIIALHRVWNDAGRWIYLRYFTAGAKIRFSTGNVFGRGEFTGLTTNDGYAVEDDYAIIPESGVYGIYVSLGSRKVAIQPLTMYTYGSATSDSWGTNLNSPFTLLSDKESMEYVVENDGRLRFNPVIDGFDFSSWQREYYVNLETMDIMLRLAGQDEPNATHVWTAGTKVKLNFRTMKAEIK